MRLFKLVIVLGLVIIFSGCDEGTQSDTVYFADAGWDSIKIHNHIAGIIIESGYDYDTDVRVGSTPATLQGLQDGDVDVYMELWTGNNKEFYEKATNDGSIETLSLNFDDNEEGLYVPTYVIEGDEDRGIDPIAPDLQAIEDLKKYPDLFEDPEDPSKGRIINAPSGWSAADLIDEKFKAYQLEEAYNNFRPGSDSALITSLAKAYEAGEPWVGFAWSPSIVTARYDLTFLEEPPYDPEIWEKTKGTKSPPNDVVVAVNTKFLDQAPEIVEFLRNYETSSELTEEAILYMEENDATPEQTAEWWLKEHEDLWTSWVPEEVTEKVKQALP